MNKRGSGEAVSVTSCFPMLLVTFISVYLATDLAWSRRLGCERCTTEVAYPSRLVADETNRSIQRY